MVCQGQSKSLDIFFLCVAEIFYLLSFKVKLVSKGKILSLLKISLNKIAIFSN